MLYICDEIDLLDDDFTDIVMPLLSEERRTKVRRLGSPQSRKASAVVYLLLRIALTETYGIDEAVIFDYKNNGKPVLRDYPSIHFNLSHSHNIAACIVAGSEAGVDVQKISKVTDRVAKRVLTANEYAAFMSSSEPEEYFCKVWTIKESFLKKTGQGIAAELRDISADTISDKMIYKGSGYFCCINGSSVKDQQSVKINHIGRDDIGKLLK